MKFPEYPPSRTELLQQISPQRLMQILSTVTEPTVSGKYVHWDDLRHREPPSGLSLPEWWLGLRRCSKITFQKSIVFLYCHYGKFGSDFQCPAEVSRPRSVPSREGAATLGRL